MMFNRLKQIAGYVLPGLGVIVALPTLPNTVQGWAGLAGAIIGGVLGVSYQRKP